MQDYIYSVIGLIAITIQLIINYKIMFKPEKNAIQKAVNKYRLLMLAIFFYYITDALWGILAGLNWIPALFIDTTIYYVAMALAITWFYQYIVEYLEMKGFLAKFFTYFGFSFFILEIISLIINFFVHCFFWFDENDAYVAGPIRYIALWIQIAMFTVSSIITFIDACKTKGEEKNRHLAIFFFSLSMFIAIIFQEQYPLLPFYALGCLIGSCILHVYVVGDESYAYQKMLVREIEQSKREEAYIRAIATEYESIAIVTLKNEDKNKDQVTIHSRLSDNIADIIDEETANELNYSKKLQLFADRFVYPDDREQFIANTRREKVLESFKENKCHTVDFRLSKKDGGYFYYQLRFTPIRDSNGIPYETIAGMRSIDSEIRKELGIRQELEDAKIAAEAANRAKSTFLFNMSHDIRTPMNAIIGFTDIAEKHIDDPERVHDSLKKVKMSSMHLLTLVNDVLDMSRVESGTVKIEEEVVNIDMAADNLFSLLNGSAQEKNITFTSVIDESVKHKWIYTDRLNTMRILTNIVSNSVKYTNAGGKVSLTAEEFPGTNEGYGRYRYTVIDNGIGMNKEFLNHVFEPFSRAESATKSGIIGTGLGMSITKSLVELMGGTIEIESEIGVGTTVRVEFENKFAEPVKLKKSENSLVSINLKGKKILLVEDTEFNAEIAVESLNDEGISVDVAEDGDIAVEKMINAKEGQYDVILMDIQMPRMNGYDATRAIRNLPNEYAANIPIIAMTANAFDEDKKNAFAAGMNAHISKPVNMEKLMKALSEILSLKN